MTDKYLRERLARYRQVKLSVIGRKFGKTISIPVWFVLEGEKLFLLPVQGPETKWYKNVLKNPSIRIDARRRVPSLSRDGCEHCQIRDEKFREKYGAKDVNRYYSKFDVAVVVETGAINGLLEPNRATGREAHPVRIS
jgi:hypothetical protein